MNEESEQKYREYVKSINNDMQYASMDDEYDRLAACDELEAAYGGVKNRTSSAKQKKKSQTTATAKTGGAFFVEKV